MLQQGRLCFHTKPTQRSMADTMSAVGKPFEPSSTQLPLLGMSSAVYFFDDPLGHQEGQGPTGCAVCEVISISGEIAASFAAFGDDLITTMATSSLVCWWLDFFDCQCYLKKDAKVTILSPEQKKQKQKKKDAQGDAKTKSPSCLCAGIAFLGLVRFKSA